ncbi:hypothetical protein TWF569_007442 [Orbilia oligospora]|uniref:Cystathionine gamma-synthase n=2 Tax=Orbilia oligospora TaxID=2813651 RepID=A0A7C8J0D7_ORBOL|nr:hypothetical protein TWF102_002204 [Orbilia oligospora]KAF3088445.1 hypothetical protein TWF103_001132 [Orbilia oligospora]KAF3092890.1 hypothetical protein TWF706_008882 [Orbilia oligospora]KAF3135627.1 hypothetical protein TWF594_008351 [Orbilia oligospora]KAF3143038.1 hypothetical protein TWF569_007442 [Orbilia oligospora]
MSKFILQPSAVTGIPSKYSTETNLVHADEFLNEVNDVAPPIHVSTTFRYPRDPSKLIAAKDLPLEDADSHVYSRLSSPSTARLEALLSSHLNGYAIVYSSGVAAFHAALVHLNPRQLSGSLFYHGCHGVADIHSRLTGMKQIPLDCPVEDLQPGDVVHLETPLNPLGTAFDIKYYADRAHSRGAILMVDSTFAPPPLQDPFEFGADIVMHSGSKYIGGHSDMLAGVLVTRDIKTRWKLWDERLYLGGVMGNLEAWLGTRSARTLEMRVLRQSENATKLVGWLSEELGKEGSVIGGVVENVKHASLQEEEWVRKQMKGGFGPVFGIEMKTELLAKTLPSHLELFAHATSLGGVESLIEWRAMSDTHCPTTLLRLSIGVENWEDLRNDLFQAFEKLAKGEQVVLSGKH